MTLMMHESGFLSINRADNTADFVTEVSVNHSLALGSHFVSDFLI